MKTMSDIKQGDPELIFINEPGEVKAVLYEVGGQARSLLCKADHKGYVSVWGNPKREPGDGDQFFRIR